MRRFFLDYCERAARTGGCRFAFLDIGGRSVAAQLSVVWQERLWVLKIGYDEAWSRCSPGWLLLAETLRDAFDRGLRSYEFLGSDEPWLHAWPATTREFSTLQYYSPGWAGWCGRSIDVAARTAGRLARVIRARLHD